VTGLAASAASIVAMAGNEIAIASNAFVMIHRSWGLTIGNTADHTETADLLAQIDDGLAATYVARTGQGLEQIQTWMSDETWFGATAAIDAGFADEEITGNEPKAAFDLSLYAHVPDVLKQGRGQSLDIKTKTDLEQLLRSAGCSRSQAKAVTAGGFAALVPPTSAPNEVTELMARIAKATASLEGKSQ
jgi:hypothetical protein